MATNENVSAGRGFLLIAGAKAWFLVTSAGVALGLPRLLGEPEAFGRFKVVSSLATIVNMVLITATIQAVARLTSERPKYGQHIRRLALRTQILFGGGLAIALFVLANPLCERLFGDGTLAPYLRLAAIVAAAYSVYAVFVGLLNGLSHFGTQAALDIVFSTLKATLIVGFVALGFGVMGAFTGFAIAAVTIACIAAAVSHRRLIKDPSTPNDARAYASRYLQLLWPIATSALLLNFIIQLDVLMVKGIPNPSTYGVRAIDRASGLFGGAKNISLLPYQATFALTFVVFPMLSKAGFEGDLEKIQQWIRQALRFTLILGAAAAVVLVTTAEPALRLLMGSEYAAAAPALRLLLPSALFLAEFVLGITILNASGHERTAAAIAAITLVLLAIIQWLGASWALSTYGLDALPVAAGFGTLFACFAGFCLVSRAMHKRFQAHLSGWTFGRVALAFACAVTTGQAFAPDGLINLLAMALMTGIVYVATLFALREITSDDIKLAGRVLTRK
jgi:O-antigen/teichoic acid export membrane protein